MGFMADPKELPQQVEELVQLTKQYLRQETVDPLRRIGQLAAKAGVAAVLLVLAVVLFSLALHQFLSDVLPDTSWWAVAAAGITAVVSMVPVGILATRIRGSGE